MRSAPRTVVFWDIDGTLLTTGRAGVFAFEEAVLEVAGVDASFREIATSGMTDAEVAATFLEAAGLDAPAERVEAVLREYERRLPAALGRRRGRVLDGVAEVLTDLAGRDDVQSLLLTGNTHAGARAKLAHYRLDGFFRGGAFCEGPGPRVEIAQRAVAALDGAGGAVHVVGDTPQDVRCGKAVGARTIAVASGSYSLEQLREEEPWALLERIPEPAAFRSLVGLA